MASTRNIHVRNLELDEVEDLFYITSFYHGQGEGFTTNRRKSDGYAEFCALRFEALNLLNFC